MDFSLWLSRSSAISHIIQSYTFDVKDFVLIFVIGMFLVILALLGFGFYLWHLKSSNEHTQSRLLNILIMFVTINRALTQDEFEENEHFLRSLRVTAMHVIAVSFLFLLISIATVLNHFKPGLYLDVSLNWRHKIAIPVMVISFILAEHTIYSSCHRQNETFMCEPFIIRTMEIYKGESKVILLTIV